MNLLKMLVLKNPYQLFLSILLPFLLSTVVLLFAQSSFLHLNFERFSLNTVYDQQKTNLQNTSQNVNVIAGSARSVAITAFFDDTIKNLLYSDAGMDEYIKYYNKMQSYKNIYPFLHSIYVYNGHQIFAFPSTDFVYNRMTFNDKGIFPIMGDIRQHRSHSIVLRQIPNFMAEFDSNAEPEVFVYSYLFFDSQIVSGKVSEAIILNISQDTIKQTVRASETLPGNRTFIVDADGKLLSEDNEHPLLSDLSSASYIQTIRSSQEKSGNLRAEVDGVDSLITYATADVFDWKVISITPYYTVVRDIEKMKERTYWFASLFIVCSVLLSLFFTRRLYLPIKMVIQNYKALESEQRNAFYYQKQDFLRHLIHSSDLIPDAALRAQFVKYKVALEPADRYLSALIRLDHYADFCETYRHADRKLLMFGLVNIISELIAKTGTHECIEVDEDRIFVLMRYDSPALPSENEQLRLLAADIQHCSREYLNLSVSIAFSEAFESLAPVNFHYLKTVDLSEYRMILGHQCIIFNETLHYRTDVFNYPQDQEKELTDALIQGHAEAASAYLSEMIKQASEYSYSVLNTFLIRLLLSIRQVIEVMEINQGIKLNFNFNTYLSKLQQVETIETIQFEFISLFERLAQELGLKKSNKYIKLINDVEQMIDAEFGNPALSLDSISDRVNLSPPYLGRLFKKYRLISIMDYINQVRLSYASDQIASSDDTINDIMEKSGFTSRSHFYTLFKKTYGLTPNQYRSNFKAGK